MVSQWKAITKAAVDDQPLRSSAAACNMAHVDTAEFVAVLGTYCGRKALRMYFLDATFHEAPPMATNVPAIARAQEQRINELTALLQRKSAEMAKNRVPRAQPLTAAHVNELASTKMRFQWMNTLLSAMQGLEQVPLNAQDWLQDVFVQKVWCLLHLEIATRCQPRQMHAQWSHQAQGLRPLRNSSLPTRLCRPTQSSGNLSVDLAGLGAISSDIRWDIGPLSVPMWWDKVTLYNAMAKSFGSRLPELNGTLLRPCLTIVPNVASNIGRISRPRRVQDAW